MSQRRNRVRRHNYHTDSRVQAGDRAKRFKEHVDLDEERKIALVSAGGLAVEVPFEWDVCSVCDGEGTVTNPNVDAGGISTREMNRRGPEFRRSYERGDYDVDCPKCEGRRVEPELNPQNGAQEDVVEVLHETLRRAASTDQMRRAEKAMGA